MCDKIQADHAPEAGVVQGIFHGILVKHHSGIQGEVEEDLEKEVERRGEENTQEQVRMTMTMDGNEGTQTRFEPHVTMSHECNASTDGAQRAQNYAVFTSVCIVVFMQLVAMCSRLLKLCVKMYVVFRNHCVSLNVRENQVQDVFHLQKTGIPTNGSMVKNHISLKTEFGLYVTRRISFQSWFLT